MIYLTIILIGVGEALAIVAELWQAKHADKALHLSLLPGLAIFLLSGILLLSGYWLGYRSTNKIWVITIISLSTIVIVEGLLNYLMFHELPARGAAIGLPLAVAAVLAATLYR